MRIYALYERSKKVLALYTVVAVIFFIVGFVSLNFTGNEYPAWYSVSNYVVKWAKFDEQKGLQQMQFHVGCSVIVDREE